jgi:hypothetical protein
MLHLVWFNRKMLIKLQVAVHDGMDMDSPSLFHAPHFDDSYENAFIRLLQRTPE